MASKGPLGKSVEFDARIIEANPERGTAWQSLQGGGVDTSGQVRFEEVATGRTCIDVAMNYADSPGGNARWQDGGGGSRFYMEP